MDINDDLHIAYRHNSGQDLYHATVQGHNTGSSARSALSGASCTFSPSLPTGLNVESGTCTISGAPSSIQFNTTHTITATSSTGMSYTGEFYLNVLDQTPVISYTGSPFTYTKDVAISPISPANAGGDIPLHVIDSIGDVGNYSSMAMDSNGKMHISYVDITNTQVKYATDKSGAWVDAVVGTGGGYTSIALDSNNNVHIAYILSLNLYHATDKTGSWVSSVADSTSGTGFYATIAIDSNDKVHIAHKNIPMENISKVKHVEHIGDGTHIPQGDMSIERRYTHAVYMEHALNLCNRADIPHGNISIERIGIGEQGHHIICNRTNIPHGNVSIEHVSIAEHIIHVRNSTHIPHRNI